MTSQSQDHLVFPLLYAFLILAHLLIYLLTYFYHLILIFFYQNLLCLLTCFSYLPVIRLNPCRLFQMTFLFLLFQPQDLLCSALNQLSLPHFLFSYFLYGLLIFLVRYIHFLI